MHKVPLHFTLFVFVLLLTALQSDFSSEHKEMTDNESIRFGNPNLIPSKRENGIYRKGSYDGTGFSIVNDKKGVVSISDLEGCPRKHQNEFQVLWAHGEVTRKKDTLVVQANTPFKNFYFVRVNKGEIAETFSPPIEIKLVSQTLQGSACRSLVSVRYGLEIVALPQNVSIDQLYKPFHRNETVGVFSFLSITDSKGITKNFEEADYVLMGGNALKAQ